MPDGSASDDVALLALRNVPMTDRIRSEFEAAPEALAAMRGLLRRWLRHAGAGEQETAEIVTACGEAATNAIEHAGAAGEAPFEVAGLLDGRRVDVTVRDRGAWRSPRQGDRGRGLSLMRALMDQVDVSPGPDGTRVRLQRELTWRGGLLVSDRLVGLEIEERGDIVIAHVTGELDIAEASITGDRIT